MIRIETSASDDILEARLSGRVTAQDYQDVVLPAVEAALETHERIRLLAVFGEDFEGYDLNAVWQDMKLGLGHWNGFDRVAVVTGTGWISGAVRAFAPLMPCPVKVFALAETDDAHRWLRESLGAVHITRLDDATLQARLLGQPGAEDYERAEDTLAGLLSGRDRFRVLLDLRDFDGWQGLSAMTSHFTLVRDHAARAEKVAVVGNHAWQRLAQRIVGRFVPAETQFFPETRYDAARDWLAEG